MNGKFYRFDNFLLDTQTKQLFYKNKSINLSYKSFDILLYLIQNPGRIVTKEEIFQSVWTDSFVEENNLPVHVSALRRVLGEKRGDSRFIKTVSGRGYSFIANVEEIDKLPIIVSTLPRKIASGSEDELSDTLTSIAILPFTSENKTADFEYLAGGITQSLIDSLSQLPKLKVMAYTAVKNYQNFELNLQEIGFQLGVDKILYGTIIEFKNNLEISVELINAADKSYLWGTQYNCQFADVFAVKQEISLVIAEKLKLRLKESDKSNLAKPQTSDSDAYKLYLKGNFIMDDFASHNDRRKRLSLALSFFQQSIKKDPQFAPTYAAVGRVYFFLFHNDFISRGEALTECRTALHLALNLNPRLSEAFVLKGMLQMFLEFDFREAEVSLIRAIELNPSNAYAYHMQSLLYLLLSKFDEAIFLQNKAIQLDPTSMAYNCGLINRFYYTKNFNKALVQAEETIELNERSGPAYLMLSLAYIELGLFDEAIKYSQKAFDNSPTEEVFLAQSYIYAVAGNESKARDILSRIQANQEFQKSSYLFVALVYNALGETDRALDYAEKGFEKEVIDVHTYMIKFDPRFRHLCEQPRFASLLQKLEEK